ncbi:hypothetical protein B296_00038267 [Ensete ventricosum]|uniref:Uncharacterized protein n=1 Tax=Ensete ventricosum TaxID=4639 RepID=A0A426YBJ7_ENSVE|nr:hypothetical protein B296_00038267 [Ensete ventricosum]
MASVPKVRVKGDSSVRVFGVVQQAHRMPGSSSTQAPRDPMTLLLKPLSIARFMTSTSPLAWDFMLWLRSQHGLVSPVCASSSVSVGKRRESSKEVRRVSDVRPRMLLLEYASRDALDRRLPRGPAQRPSRCGVPDVALPTIKSVPRPRWSQVFTM